MRYFLTLLLSLLPLTLFAQTQHSINIDEMSFAPVQTDAISGVAIDKIGKDHSQRECARIKMRINRMTAAEIGEISVRPRGGNVEVMKCVVAGEGNGLIIELTAKEPTRFYITHPKYGDSNEVSLNLEGNREYRINAELNTSYPIFVSSNITGADVYIDNLYMGRTDDTKTLTIKDIQPGSHILRLLHGSSSSEREIIVSDDNLAFYIEINTATSRPQYVVFHVEPNTAVVVIDNKNYVLDNGGYAQTLLSNGIYKYQISAKDYHSEKGEFTVNGAKVNKDVTLKPAFGWLNIAATGTLKDATIYVDDTLVGTTPISRYKLSSGTHHVRIVKSMYLTYEDNFTINDSEQLSYTATLTPDFATVTISADAGSNIYVNDVLKGKSSWSGMLSTGTYIFEARKEGHRTTSLTKNISAEPAQQSYKLDTPTPIIGTINVSSTPIAADLYVDGKLVDQTPAMVDLLVGKHKITIRKEGYADHEQTITVEEGKVTDVTATLSEHKVVKATGSAYTETVNGINLKMILVEGGTFSMGSNDGENDEKTVHDVTLDSYYVGETEITQAQWRAIMGSNPSDYTGDNRPVEKVSWEDAQAFCKKLSELTGKHYVLPTEAQWEYAARGGNKSKGYTYSGSNSIDEVAVYDTSSHSNVKSKLPNELGIYDMSGNVLEWCSDWYDSSYPFYRYAYTTNPQGPTSGNRRVLRGGSWVSIPFCCRVASRDNSLPSDHYSLFGFRVVCVTNLPSSSDDKIIFVTAEEMPTFKGGDLSKFRNWVQSNVKYPQIALENGIQGNVVIKFVVEKDGKLSNIQVLQSPDKTLADAAVQVIQRSPKWKPGKQRNKPVPVTYTLPVSFKISK